MACEAIHGKNYGVQKGFECHSLKIMAVNLFKELYLEGKLDPVIAQIFRKLETEDVLEMDGEESFYELSLPLDRKKLQGELYTKGIYMS